MSRVLLDTSSYSAFLRGDVSIKRSLQEADEIVVNPVVLGELKAGFLRGKSRRRNEDELALFLGSPRVTVARMDEGTSDRYAAILDGLRRAGTPIPTNDLWIAATAMQYGLSVVTTDAHFLRVPQILVEPSHRASE
jgi:predicted nucleic acid-binding protein